MLWNSPKSRDNFEFVLCGNESEPHDGRGGDGVAGPLERWRDEVCRMYQVAVFDVDKERQVCKEISAQEGALDCGY